MKTKLLLILCLLATLNFSCEDDENDKIKLTLGELSLSEGRYGDKVSITGLGFSELKEENIVTINDLVIPVEEATSSKLVIIIPKEATTGKLSVKVGETSIDCGTFTVHQLTLGELNFTEGRSGDKISITGEGFSELKEENIVTINDLVIPVEEATSSKLVITIPKEAITGKLSVKVGEVSIDYGIFTVRIEKLFAIKSNYSEGIHNIVLIDPETGTEEPFMQLPKLDKDVDIMYSSLCYLSKTKEFLIMTRAEWPVRDYSILRIDIETKAIIKKEFNGTEKLEDIGLFTDGENNIYLAKDFESTEIKSRKTSIYEFNIESGAQILLTETTGDYIFDCKVNKAIKQLLMVIDNNGYSDRETKLLSFDFDTKQQIEIPLTYSKSLYGFEIALDNDIYVANETVFTERKELMKINTVSGVEEVITELPKPKEWYGHPTYFKTSNELIYLLTNDNDVTTSLLKIDLTNKTTTEVSFQASSKTYYEAAFSIFI